MLMKVKYKNGAGDTQIREMSVRTEDNGGLSLDEAVQSVNSMQRVLRRPEIRREDVITIEAVTE